MAYVYVTGINDAPDAITEEFQVKQILHWSGFTTDAQKNSIYNDPVQNYDDLLNMSEKAWPI